MQNPKTIQIFIPDGSPRSIRIAEITSRTVKVILIPRNKLEQADKRDEVKSVGIYLLFGECEDRAKPLVYVGEAENCYKRLKEHNQRKDFWKIAAVIISKTNSFTKAHAKYLESYCYSKIKNSGIYELENSSLPTKSHVTETMEADIMDYFETIKILLSTLGYPLFEEVSKTNNDEIFYCKRKEAYAEGKYIDDGFVVFIGSKCNFKESNSAIDSWISKMREKLIGDGILKQDDNTYVFTTDYIFNSPSAAAGAVLAAHCNGWIEWKNKNGKTLDEVKRRS